ncbi:aromatic prenyltransferase [Streptomyces cinereoruber]|uniref:aromatic prenyltransferase n=1 Tax=Streptomyces cinereoruber TaxID=67260 RepID=UPI003EB7BB94
MAHDENDGRRYPSAADRFSRTRFLADLRATATALGAPYSEDVTNTVLDAYAPAFHEGAVLWRTTDRPGAGLDYRFYARRPTDTVTIAQRAGFITGDDPLAGLVRTWSGLYGGAPEQSCDFDAALGPTKTWVYLAGTRPLDDVLGAPGIPGALRRTAPVFHGLGLDHVRHVAVDYRHRTVNLYFRARGPVDPDLGPPARRAHLPHAVPAPLRPRRRDGHRPGGDRARGPYARGTGRGGRRADHADRRHHLGHRPGPADP